MPRPDWLRYTEYWSGRLASTVTKLATGALDSRSGLAKARTRSCFDEIAWMASISGCRGARPLSLIASVSVKLAKKSPIFCSTVPAAAFEVAESSMILRTRCSERSARTVNDPYVDLSPGSSKLSIHKPPTWVKKSSPGETLASTSSTLMPKSPSSGDWSTVCALVAGALVCSVVVVELS